MLCIARAEKYGKKWHRQGDVLMELPFKTSGIVETVGEGESQRLGDEDCQQWVPKQSENYTEVNNNFYSSDNHVKGKRGEACYDRAKKMAKRCMPGLKHYNFFKDNQQHARPDRIDIFFYKHQRVGILAAEIHNHAQHYISSHEWVEENDINKFDGVQADKKVSAGSFRYGQKSKEDMKAKRIDCWNVLPDQILNDEDVKGMTKFLAAMITAWILEVYRELMTPHSSCMNMDIGVYNRYPVFANYFTRKWLEEVKDG